MLPFPPAIGGNANTVNYVEGGVGEVIDNNLTISDLSSVTLIGATVSISNGFTAGDTLEILGSTSGSIGSISYSFSGSTLTLTGSDSTAHYQAALRQVLFQNPNDSSNARNENRTITWQVNDGSNLSNQFTSTVDVISLDDPPVITINNASPPSYTEGGSSVKLAPNSNLTDPDNFLMSALRVAITNFQPGDVLSLDPGLSGGISAPFTAQYDPLTGIFSFPANDASPTTSVDTVNDYLQGVLKAMQYSSTSADPTNGGANPTRTISWQIWDTSVATSATPLFQSPVAYSTGAGTGPVALSNLFTDSLDTDVNGDLQTDLITADMPSGQASVLINHNGDGTFTSPTGPFAAGANASSVVAGNFNEDIDPNNISNDMVDLIVGHSTGNMLSLLLGDGQGHFAAPTSITVGNDPQFVLVGHFNDINPNFHDDLAVANGGDADIMLLYGNGDGTFQGPVTLPTGADANANPVFIATAEFNAPVPNPPPEGPDFAIANRGDDSITIYQGNGSGGFTRRPDVLLPSGSQPVAIATGDFNGDLTQDLAVANFGNNTITLEFGNGDGTFTPGPVLHTLGLHPTSIIAQDVDGNGRPDLIVTDQGDTTDDVDGDVEIFLANPNNSLNGPADGTFQAPTVLSLPSGTHPTSISTADFNLDGNPDLAVTDPSTNNVYVLLHTPTTPSQVVTSTIDVQAVDNAPVASAPASYPGGPENATINLHNNSLSISDVDGGTGQETATLSVTTGTLHAVAGTGVSSGVQISGDGTNSLTITGTIAQINGLLNSDATSVLTFTGDVDANDTPNSVTLSLSVNDNGNTGSGGPLTSNTAQATIGVGVDDATVSFTGLSAGANGSPVQGQQITATVTDGERTVSGATFTWKVGGKVVGNSGNTYTPGEADEGGALTLDVSFTDPNDNSVSEKETGVAVGSPNTVQDSADLSATLSTQSPVQGTPISVATASDGGTNVLGAASYQWKVNTGSGFVNATGTGANTATYTPTEGDEGGALEVVVSVTDPGNLGPTETTTVVAGNVVADSADLVVTLSSNSPVDGTPISVASASDGGTNVLGTATYQWKVNTGFTVLNANGSGATTATYTPTEFDEGLRLEVVVAFTEKGSLGGIDVITVVAGNAVADSMDLTATLSTNSPVQGSPISVTSVTDGGFDASVFATYQWKINTGSGFVDATGPAGATSATYTPTEGDEGGTLEVVVSFSHTGNPGDTESTTVVAGTVQENPAENTTISLAGLASGNAVEGRQITATVTDPDAPASGINYTWKVNGTTVFAGADAAGNTYTPTEANEGLPITVSASFTDTHGNAESGTTSAGTVQENPAENATISLAGLASGNAVEGRQITATVTDPDAPASGINYTWKVNGTTVFSGTDAAGNTYTPTEANEGLPISVSASFTDTHGNAESGTVSAGTVQENPVENATISLAGLASGNAVEGRQITATVTDPDAPASGINYTWKVNGTTVFTGADAAGNTYTPTEANEGLPISVSASFTDTHGNAESGTVSAGTVQESPAENALFTVSGLVNGRVVTNNAITATITEPDAPASGITYTWKVNGTTMLTGLDAAGKTFTPQASDAGKSLTLTVAFTDTHGFAETGTGPVGSAASAVPYDVNGDTISDLVFQNNGEPAVWLWNGTAPTAEVPLANPGASWHVITSRDLNGDGKADLIWQNADGAPGVWLMNGTTPTAQVGLINISGASWHLLAAGDVNGDGDADLIWQNADGTPSVWLMNGTTPTAEVLLTNPGANWKVVGAADYNGDGKDDILLQDRNTGNLMIDLMNGTTITSSQTITQADPSWHAVSTGEFNGQAEIAFQNSNGTPSIWLMNGTTPAAEVPLINPGPGWQLISVDHFTPDGQADLLFQNTNGAMGLWELNGTSIAAMVGVPNPGSGWQSVNGHPFATG
jgi:FG-GAP-like repeat